MAILSRQLLVCLAASLCYPLAGAGRENPARDDTFAELNLREADVTIALADVLIGDRRFGRERFTTNLRSFANVIGQPNVTIDARGSRWRFQSYPVPTACYPISIREAGEGLYWGGGLVVGTNPLEVGWLESYVHQDGKSGNGAALLLGKPSANGVVVDGVRSGQSAGGVEQHADLDRPGGVYGLALRLL